MLNVSKYTFKTLADDGTLLLYNTRTGAFLAFSGEHARECDKLLSSVNISSDSTIAEALRKQGVLIEAGFDEAAQVKKRHLDFMSNEKELQLTLLPSENCNFRCPYCFIYDRRGMAMKHEVYNAALALISRKIGGVSSLAVNWFGGEPTLEKDGILAFMGEVRGLLRARNGIKFSSRIYTNGYLLTAPAFLEYLDSGITFFQVTLDGNRETHDKVRSLRNGGGTFDVIWKNLCDIQRTAAADARFTFKIRVNFMKGQDAEIKELLEDYKKVFGTDPRFSIYFRMVSNMDTSRDDIRPIASSIYDMEEGLSKQVDYYLNAADKLGRLDTKSRITAPVPDPIGGWCAAQKKDAWIIGADGLVFKCDTLIGDASTACGRLLENGMIESFDKTCAWAENIYDEEKSQCMSCKFLTVCQGGCPRDRKNRLASGKCYYTEATIEKAMKETHLHYKKQETAAKSVVVGAEGTL